MRFSARILSVAREPSDSERIGHIFLGGSGSVILGLGALRFGSGPVASCKRSREKKNRGSFNCAIMHYRVYHE